jgi:hypothetical protein
MNYEAVLVDSQRGLHRRGVGPNPTIAAMHALRKMLAFELDEQQERKVDDIGPAETVRMLCVVSVDDEHLENPKNLREDINEQKILVRVDRTKEAMYTPIGWIRPIF